MLTPALGLARKVLKKVYLVESEKVQDQSIMLIPGRESTTQEFELFKQMAGFAPAEQTNEGDSVKFDNQYGIFTLKLKPYLVTKGVRYSKLMQFTNQYKEVTTIQPQWARAFKHKRNQVAADMYNTGFTSTSYGVNSEKLFTTSHSMGISGYTFGNRPTTDIAFGPAALKQAMTELRKQKSARNTPQPVLGKLRVILPPALEPDGITVINSMQMAGTADNDTNEFIRNRCEPFVCDYLTSDLPWFVISTDKDQLGIVWLDQMDYDVEQLARDKALMDTWVGSESYRPGWYDAHATWGTTGS